MLCCAAACPPAGAALLRVRAAEALRPLFLAGSRGLMPRIADGVILQMADVQVGREIV